MERRIDPHLDEEGKEKKKPFFLRKMEEKALPFALSGRLFCFLFFSPLPCARLYLSFLRPSGMQALSHQPGGLYEGQIQGINPPVHIPVYEGNFI